MDDARLVRAFRELDGGLQPDAAFADRLFDSLAVDLGIRPRHGSGAAGLRILRRFHLDGGMSGLRTVGRLAYLSLVVVLLLALLAAALVIGSLLPVRLSPSELVEKSQLSYRNPPAVRITLIDPTGLGVTTLTSDGHGVWRSETPDNAAGSYRLYDGSRVGSYDNALKTWRIDPVEDGGPPFPLNDTFTWTHIEFPGGVAKLSSVSCADATGIGEKTIAGRAADGVRCQSARAEYWIDRETRLVLELDDVRGITAVTHFEMLPPQAPFEWSAPSGVDSLGWPLASTVLKAGERPPAWSGRTIDGRPISSADLASPAAVLFFELYGLCNDCGRVYDDFVAAGQSVDGLRLLVVATGDQGSVSRFLGLGHARGVDVVSDPDEAIYGAWGMARKPALVLLDRHGSTAAAFAGRLGVDDLRAVLRATAASSTVPAVAPAPQPTPTPGDPTMAPDVECGVNDKAASCLPVGVDSPAWSGPRIDGGTFGKADLLGKPAVIWFAGGIGRCDGPCPDWVARSIRAFAALVDQYRGRVGFVIVSNGEREPGALDPLFAAAGLHVPVVFDWDESISSRFALYTTFAAVVVDAEGRLVASPLGTEFPLTAADLEALISARPSPAP